MREFGGFGTKWLAAGVVAAGTVLSTIGDAHASVSQIPLPPAVIPTPHGAVLAYSIVNVVMIAVVWILLIRAAIKTRSLLPIAFMLGGMLAGLVEPVFDGNIHVWFAHPPGDPASYSFYNVAYPWYVVPANSILGGPIYWVYHCMKRGVSTGGLWGFFFGWWIFDMLWELPGTTTGAYGYFGPQPFLVGGFPVWVGMMAGFGLPVAAYVIYGLSNVMSGPRLWWLTIVTMGGSIYGAEVFQWPMWDALNGGATVAQAALAALASLVITVSAYWGLTVAYAKGRAAAPAPAAAAG